MRRFTYSLEEDLITLSTLLPSAMIADKLGSCLRAIEAATTTRALEHEFSWTLGYVQAIKDMECLSAAQVPELRDLVFRAKQRSAIK